MGKPGGADPNRHEQKEKKKTWSFLTVASTAVTTWGVYFQSGGQGRPFEERALELKPEQ